MAIHCLDHSKICSSAARHNDFIDHSYHDDQAEIWKAMGTKLSMKWASIIALVILSAFTAAFGVSYANSKAISDNKVLARSNETAILHMKEQTIAVKELIKEVREMSEKISTIPGVKK